MGEQQVHLTDTAILQLIDDLLHSTENRPFRPVFCFFTGNNIDVDPAYLVIQGFNHTY